MPMPLVASLKWLKFAVAAAGLLLSEPAIAAKRVALVIGNSGYQNVPPLTNPVNDAALIGKMLKDAGFDLVDSRHDLSSIETRRALRAFADNARDADVAVVYYAGHGMEMDGSNYLIPVEAKLERDFDVEDETVSLDRVLIAVEGAKQLQLVILDACRDNPFARTMKRTVATRSIGRGLARIEPTSPNTLIAYSAKAGTTARDGQAGNSPFTVALAHHLTTPGLDVRKALGFVRDDVLKSTGYQQEPFVNGSLGGDDVALVPAPPQPVSSSAEARKDYELALQVGNKTALNAFLQQYPDGFYASLARLQLDKIAAEETQAAATEKTVQAERERTRLAALGAQKEMQEKAEAEAKAAERARLAAEKTKQAAQNLAAEAERRRIEKPPEGSFNAQPTPPSVDKSMTVAALIAGTPQGGDFTQSVQRELRRVGCLDAAADGDWNAVSQRSLAKFNRHTGTKFDTKVASSDALDAIRQKQSRVCPLICEHGYRPDGDQCIKITCAEGSFLNNYNECEKRRGKKPVAKRNTDDRPSRADRSVRERPEPTASVPRRQATARSQGGGGQIYCDANLCRPVQRGCHLEFRGGGGPGNNANAEVCN